MSTRPTNRFHTTLGLRDLLLGTFLAHLLVLKFIPMSLIATVSGPQHLMIFFLSWTISGNNYVNQKKGN
uniref:Uncharacterized protein n=1 Tax=Arundo donax TaxID=35708 RepID=A0A0A9CYT9_ARUDO